MTHRVHLDSSVELVGKLLFGSDRGPSILTAVRAPGLALVDDWACLKNMVSAMLLSTRNRIERRNPR